MSGIGKKCSLIPANDVSAAISHVLTALRLPQKHLKAVSVLRLYCIPLCTPALKASSGTVQIWVLLHVQPWILSKAREGSQKYANLIASALPKSILLFKNGVLKIKEI